MEIVKHLWATNGRPQEGKRGYFSVDLGHNEGSVEGPGNGLLYSVFYSLICISFQLNLPYKNQIKWE